MAERTCAVCGSPFIGSPRAVVCSDDCRRLRRNAQMRAFFARHKAEHGEAYTQRYREKRNQQVREHHERNSITKWCLRCGGRFAARTDAYRFCSKSCAHRTDRLPVLHPDPPEFQWLPLQHPARRRYPNIKPRLFVAGQCVRCGEGFVVAAGGSLAAYCSERCQKRDSRSLRRARKRDAFVERVHRVRIFERDGWRCQICKKKVRRTTVVPHPLAPVLDHITPLADGGTHEPANVQCAHYLCNSIKSHGAANDQLRLIG